MGANGNGSQTNKRKRASKAERKRRKRARDLLEAKGTASETMTTTSCLKYQESKDTHVSTNPSLVTVERGSMGDNGTEKDNETKNNKSNGSETNADTNGSSTQSPEEAITLGSKLDLTKRNVAFVYPKKNEMEKPTKKIFSILQQNQPRKPYVHKKLRKVDTLNGTANTKVIDEKSDGCASKAPHINESINDILYPNQKKKNKGNSEGNGSQSKIQEVNGQKGGISQPSHENRSTQNNNEDVENDIVEAKDKDMKKDVSKKENKKRKKEDKKRKKEESVSKKSKKGDVESETTTLESKTSKKSQQNSDEQKGVLTKPVLKRQLSGLTVEDAVKDKIGRRPRCNSTDGELNLPRGGLCEEHSVLESHKWDLDKLYGRKVSKPTLPRGFENTGNTCFLNATLQCLAFLPTFCQCVANLPSQQERNTNGKKLSNGQRISMYLRNFLRKVHDLSGENHKQAGRPVQPKNVAPMLNGSNRGYKFRHGRQEDAHEFLVHLLDTMHDGELKSAGKRKMRKSSELCFTSSHDKLYVLQ